MARTVDRNFMLGLLCGASLGLAAAVLLSPRCRSRVGVIVRDGVLELADRLTSGGGEILRNRRTERAGRTLQDRIERMRSAGL